MKIEAGNGADITKKPDYGDKIVVWPNDKADFSKRLVFLDKVVVKALNKNHTIAGNRVDVKQRTNSKKDTVVWLGRLVTGNKNVAGALNGANTEDSNKTSMTKNLNSKAEVITRIQSKIDYRSADNYAENFFSCNFIDILANLFSNLSSISI